LASQPIATYTNYAQRDVPRSGMCHFEMHISPAKRGVNPMAELVPNMRPESRLSRRLFLADMGRGVMAIAVLGVGGCSLGGQPSRQPIAVPPGAWQRLPLNDGFVYAYVLVRAGEAAIVDTGGLIGSNRSVVPIGPGNTLPPMPPSPLPISAITSNEDDILVALEAVGLGWTNVGHVIVTHWHPDHAGSAAAILEAAPDAQGYAGAEDIPHIVVPRPLVPVHDGDDVFGLRIVTTPGHTPGHIAVLDEALGVLVVGDALTTNDGRPTSPPVSSTEDMDEALRSVAKIAALDFETLLVGHGEPIESGAPALVREFLETCRLEPDPEEPGGVAMPTGPACRHPMDLPRVL
jgi:glyoxylase-like metal-dependent hydrolase (beta-lactamase superfamily II)